MSSSDWKPSPFLKPIRQWRSSQRRASSAHQWMRVLCTVKNQCRWSCAIRMVSTCFNTKKNENGGFVYQTMLFYSVLCIKKSCIRKWWYTKKCVLFLYQHTMFGLILLVQKTAKHLWIQLLMTKVYQSPSPAESHAQQPFVLVAFQQHQGQQGVQYGSNTHAAICCFTVMITPQ